MDLKNFENTSSLAIEAVYRHFWNMIPYKYKLPEDDERVKDLSPFYDPELTFENRLHYKLTNVSYPNRANPWFIITWNTENGLLKSSLSRRRFQTAVIENKKLGKIRYKFINTDLNINFGICCNSMMGLFELQENIVLQKRDKMVVYTKPHSVLESFPVCIDIITSNQNKLQRDKGTLCYLFMQCTIDYPIIGMAERITGGIIEEINSKIIKDDYSEYIYAEDKITGKTNDCDCSCCND